MKPIETGCRIIRGKSIAEDTELLIKAASYSGPVDSINPYRLKNPLAPSVAAEIEGVNIRKKKILAAYKSLLKKHDLTVVEGAGGIMVPYYKRSLFLDLMKDMRVPIVIVSRPGLGTINHTLLTVEAAKRKGIKTLGVIINYSSKTKKGPSEKTNPQVIAHVPILGVVPYLRKPDNKIFSEIAGKILPELTFKRR
jgi:dethiobiotin synthetase